MFASWPEARRDKPIRGHTCLLFICGGCFLICFGVQVPAPILSNMAARVFSHGSSSFRDPGSNNYGLSFIAVFVGRRVGGSTGSWVEGHRRFDSRVGDQIATLEVSTYLRLVTH